MEEATIPDATSRGIGFIRHTSSMKAEKVEKEPLVYVIVLNYNNLKDTIETLENLKNLDYENLRIIVVDNGSEKWIVEEIKKRFRFEVIENQKNLGYAGGNNVGISKALSDGAEYVFVLNNDVIVERDVLKKMVGEISKRKEYAACQPLVKYYDKDAIWSAGTKIFLGYPKLYLKGKKEAKGIFEPPFGLAGCAILFRAEALRDVGLLNEKLFLMHEETEWCIRAKKKGYRFLVVANAIVYHKVSATLGFLSEKYLYYVSRNWLIVARKLGRLFFVYSVITEFLVRLPYYFLLLLRSKKPRLIRHYLKGVLDGLCGRVS
ncbi:MAG: glycosyltransferase family 2 protein [Archaeoglobaceae archaeon]